MEPVWLIQSSLFVGCMDEVRINDNYILCGSNEDDSDVSYLSITLFWDELVPQLHVHVCMLVSLHVLRVYRLGYTKI